MKIYNKLLVAVLAYGIIACGSSESPLPELGTTSFTETFTGTDAAAWPSGWSTVSSTTGTMTIDIQTNRGRLQSKAWDGINSNTGLSRVINGTLNIMNADVVLTVEFENFANQGVGIYLRQNGGYLTDSAVNGQGYGVFWEGNGANDLGLWYELNGVETRIIGVNPIATVLNNTKYQIRFQVEQVNSNDTIQRARVWLAIDPEPATWDTTITSSYADLQNSSGVLAVDLFNFSGTSSIYVDDIVVTQLN